MKYIYIAFIALVIYIMFNAPETYEYSRADYSYGSIDTNPNRRVSGPFDGCHPGDM